jgi:UDP-glucuronate decarboxylase
MNNHKFKNKNLLITGATGFIGKNILDYILINNIQFKSITIITRNINNFKLIYPNIKYFNTLKLLESDIKNLIIEDKNFEIIIHAATSVVENISSINLYHDIIIGTENILKIAIKNNCELFINFSSGAVYGIFNEKKPKYEHDNLLISTEYNKITYSISKITTEHLCYIYSLEQKFKILNLRCFSFIGNYLNKLHYAIGEFINLAIQNKDIHVKGSNNVYRSYLHTINLCEWLFKLINYKYSNPTWYSNFNVGSDQAIGMIDLANLVKNLTNSKSNIIANNNSSDIMYYIPNIDLIKTLVGCNIIKNLEESIIDLSKIYIKEF